MENVLFKISYPAEFHAQTAVEAAMKIYEEMKTLGKSSDEIVRIDIRTHEACIRIIDKKGPLRNPADRDHTIQYMVAIPIIFGRLTARDYEDDVAAFNFKKDIDVDGLLDNLNRPLSELYLTIIKNDNDNNPTSINNQYWLSKQQNLPTPYNTRFWTKISAGYLLEDDVNVNYNVRSYGDNNYIGSLYFENIDESDDIFDGDIVEYNENELLERRLEIVYHRINTVYRERLNEIDSSKENKKEGYIYEPFNLIKIREFANFINPIVNLQSVINKYNITNQIEILNLKKSFGIPDYATEISPNVFKWRQLLEIGEIDSTGNVINKHTTNKPYV